MNSDKRTSRAGQSSAGGVASSFRGRLRRYLLPGLIAAAFISLGAVLILAYPRGDDSPNRSAGTAETGAGLGAAPPFTLPSVDGGDITLSELLPEGNVLLFFNEGVM